MTGGPSEKVDENESRVGRPGRSVLLGFTEEIEEIDCLAALNRGVAAVAEGKFGWWLT